MEPNRFSEDDPAAPPTNAHRIRPRSAVVPVPVPVNDGNLLLGFVISDHAAMFQTALASQPMQFRNRFGRGTDQPDHRVFTGDFPHLFVPVGFRTGDFVERVHGISAPEVATQGLI